MQTSATSVARPWRALDVAVLAIVSAVIAFLLWDKLPDLLYQDPPWWLQEIFRAARGQLPYRDFEWHFPPFAVMLYGYALRILGVRFAVVCGLMDIISFAIVFACYSLLRRLLPSFLCVFACLLVIVVCATSQTYFSLFSLFGYSLALQTGALGLLLLLNGVIGLSVGPRVRARTVALLACGSFIALLSKPEAIVGCIGILACALVFDPLRRADAGAWTRRWAVLLVSCFLPALGVYIVFAVLAGPRVLLESITGFGLATMTCPWWPTGIGLLAALAGIGAGAALVALGAVVAGAPQRWPLTLVLAGLFAYLGFEVFVSYSLRHMPSIHDIAGLATTMGSTSNVFRAVLWPAILYWVYLLARGIRRGLRLSADELGMLLLLTAPVLVSARSLFGTVLTPYPEVPAMCYPFVAMLAAVLLYLALHRKDTARPAAADRFIAVVLLLYMALRIGASYPAMLSGARFQTLETNAGPIRLRDNGQTAAIYRYVVTHTKPSDQILEVPYGGGIAFASGRSSPTYSTLFMQLHPPEWVQRIDLERAQRNPPALVIAPDEDRLGTFYGIAGSVGCEFPRLVWESHRAAGEPGRVLPLTQFIETHYRVCYRTGRWIVLEPKR
jgi:hypothetical protein